VQNDWATSIETSLIKLLGKHIWEVRSTLDNRIARILFFIVHGEIILLHAFIKKTQKTPPQEIETALKRMKKYRNI
jgi:phage-related protein